MTVFKKLIYLAIISALLPFCRPSKLLRIYNPTIELHKFQLAEVNLQELIENKASYQGKLVETSGYASFEIEQSAIYYDMVIPTLESVHQFRNRCGLWLEFGHEYSPDIRYLATLNAKLVKAKGLFDTAKSGHVGGCYRASLTKVFDLATVEK